MDAKHPILKLGKEKATSCGADHITRWRHQKIKEIMDSYTDLLSDVEQVKGKYWMYT